jgi:hypothetical protein
MLRKLSGFKYATTIDLSMGYNHMPLDLEGQKLCTQNIALGQIPVQKVTTGCENEPRHIPKDYA